MDTIGGITRIAFAPERGDGGGVPRFARALSPATPSRTVDSNGVVKRRDTAMTGSGETRYDAQTYRQDRRQETPEAQGDSGAGELVVGPQIRFKGQIDSCDTLIVHGHVEAALPARAIRIGRTGEYHGTAEVDEAEIAGLFDGTLTVRRRLTIAAGGKVRGTVHYAELEIAAGGEISGDVRLLEEKAASETEAAGDNTAASETSTASSTANRFAASEPDTPGAHEMAEDEELAHGTTGRSTAQSTA